MAKEISRRTFIKAGVAVGAAVAAGTYFEWKGNNIPVSVQSGTALYDVLIIGSGGAGMRAALEAAKDKKLKIAVMTKLVPTRSATTMAQGGMNGCTGVTDSEDTPEAHAFDTVKGGDYLCDQDAIEYFAENAGKIIYEMDYYGYPFHRQEDGSFHQRKMGGSSHARASYYADKSGLATVHTLFEQCLAQNIEFISECQMLEVVVKDEKLSGVIAVDMRSGNMISVPAKTVIIATGGYGRAYWIRTTNPYSSTGDGIAACLNIGIPFKDPEMVQFHPTGLAINGVLLSESSRAEGAYLVNKDGERFMKKYAPAKMELATRDIVARAIESEISEGRGIGEGLNAAVYMDFRHISKDIIKERLGQVYDLALRFEGVDITEKPVPIRCSCHYSMGGIDVIDYKTCATKVPGVFAAGECSCVSVHGANRLGANSLSEVLLFGKTAGNGASEHAKKTGYIGDKETLDAALTKWNKTFEEVTARTSGAKVVELRDKMASTMWFKAGVYREENQLQEGLKEIDLLIKEYQNCYVGDASRSYNTAFMNYVELGNLLLVSKAIVMGAIARKESRGGHSRKDFPKRDDKNFLKHTIISKVGDTFKTEYRDVVITKFKPAERKY
ncbi:FAD-binding protein [Anaerosinus massiliensis]|uniref:FAD-binding protein n=1 Tax=Massilibacillus massiliensis TaxID=1806837 RepID=UPI000B33723E|nr:FAD-binding protein [Massilibacillus massiliensis]